MSHFIIKIICLSFSETAGNRLHEAIEHCYRETSSLVLDTMFRRYKLMDHVSAMRKYLLLGQGDLIRYLLELLDEELNQPAANLYPHNLAGILESAIRATNTQFEDPDILERLDVRLLDVQPGDTGWDVFSLDYKVQGPIGKKKRLSLIFFRGCFNLFLTYQRFIITIPRNYAFYRHNLRTKNPYKLSYAIQCSLAWQTDGIHAFLHVDKRNRSSQDG